MSSSYVRFSWHLCLLEAAKPFLAAVTNPLALAVTFWNGKNHSIDSLH